MAGYYRILTIDDDAGFLESLTRTLQTLNIELDTASDGRVALMRLRDKKYDLIITDLSMPIVDGFNFLDEAESFIEGVPVIILTASGQKKDVLRARTLRINDYLVKPVRVSALIERIRALIAPEPGLILLSDFPQQVHYRSLGSEGARLTIGGCPGPDFEKHMQEVALDMQSHLGELPALIVEVDHHFAFVPGAHARLERGLEALAKRLRVRPERITLGGSYWPEAIRSHPEIRKGFLSRANLQ